MRPITYYIKHPTRLMDSLVKSFGQWLPDSMYIKLRYRFQMGKRLNLKDPVTFQEKLQWLKLHDRNPDYTKMVDKILVKDYVSSVIGNQYVVPLLGVWDRPEDIDWESLPNRFVLKTNHSGGNTGVVICRDKSSFDRESAIKRLNASLKNDVYRGLREWPYKNIKKKVFAEEFLEVGPSMVDLPDYKWYCFNGEPKYCQVIQNRTSQETIDFFDTEWNHQDFVGLNPAALPATEQPQRPYNLEEQVRIARELSKDRPFSRVDLYSIGEKTYFGEVTLYPASGFGTFRPEQYNEQLGQMLRLPGEKVGGVMCRISDNGELVLSQPDLPDYKFFCFNGKVKLFKIDYDRNTEHHANYYDRDGCLLPFGELDYLPNIDKKIDVPVDFQKMISIAEMLADDKPFVRVDFYNVRGKIYFGELTFYPASGLGTFEPEKWNEKIGQLLILNGVNGGGI